MDAHPSLITLPQALIRFRSAFQEITGNTPFPWQEVAFSQLYRGVFEKNWTLPTGTGKTSALVIWALALALRTIHGVPDWYPRRLAYGVNRRTVVDQATIEAENLLKALSRPELRDIWDALMSLQAWDSGVPLGISTLRGQRADNGEWRKDPSRPSIVIGTVDMIGSGLLGMGYRIGYKARSIYQGFLGFDCLLFNDEAHLEPAYQTLLDKLQEYQKDYFRVISLSATMRSQTPGLTLGPEDWSNEVISKRVKTPKRLQFRTVMSETELTDTVTATALSHDGSGKPVLIYLNKLSHVTRVRSALEKKCPHKVQVLTGTLRGYERDRMMATCPIIARFLERPDKGVVPAEGTVYLVCTSAGEVGVNFSGAKVVMDLVTYDRMAQRFGRSGRFGEGAEITVVHLDAKVKPTTARAQEIAPYLDKTLKLLRKLPEIEPGVHDACGYALMQLPAAECQAAFSPAPETLPIYEDLLNLWSMTSIWEPIPGRPPVARYIHGKEDEHYKTTEIVWRREVELFTPEVRATLNPMELLGEFRIRSHEVIQDQSSRVLKELKLLAEDHGDTEVWCLWDHGLRIKTLSEIAKGTVFGIADQTIILPPSIGGLNNGMLSGKAKFKEGVEYDISDKDGTRKLALDGVVPPGMKVVYYLIPAFFSNPNTDEKDRTVIRWCVKVSKFKKSSGEMTLEDHHARAEKAARELVAKLPFLSEVEKKAIILAAKHHDLGKDRELWQKSAGNLNYPLKVLAKLPVLKRTYHRYRHELGSYLDSLDIKEFLEACEEVRDLARYEIVTHHARGIPVFAPDEVQDPKYPTEVVRQAVLEIAKLHAKLTAKYGRAKLAYLVALLRVIDAHAS